MQNWHYCFKHNIFWASPSHFPCYHKQAAKTLEKPNIILIVTIVEKLLSIAFEARQLQQQTPLSSTELSIQLYLGWIWKMEQKVARKKKKIKLKIPWHISLGSGSRKKNGYLEYLMKMFSFSKKKFIRR